DGFEPIIAMFYSVFHPTEGTKVIHQVPSGVIVPPSNEPLFDFDTIKNYVIPKPSLCNKLITLKIDKYRILGFPVNIYAQQYARNSFGFNFCFVFSYESDTTPYEGNIKRIGKMFRALEEQSQLLSKSLKDSHKISSIESLIQQIFQDLNNYSECMIPIDASNSVDLKLFPISPPPPQVHSHDVPIALVKLDLLIDSLWDPTMLKIMPFINGINSIAQISEFSDANLDLTKECIRHLLHYKSIALLDIFQFQNHYTITSLIGNFLRDPNMASACQDYVLNIRKITLPSKATLFQLYNALNSNMSVSQWYMENAKLLEFIDVRKFITFGTRNGIITRIHWYPV
ncbi:hypothetical protein PICMEDRAFT_27163, partial [Pichia membranifaciens NRRL Y-2026]